MDVLLFVQKRTKEIIKIQKFEDLLSNPCWERNGQKNEVLCGSF